MALFTQLVESPDSDFGALHQDLKISDKDLEQVQALRCAGVLQDVRHHQIRAPQGFMSLFCPDCDQVKDKLDFLLEACGSQCNRKRVHTFGMNGGGLVIAPDSPIGTRKNYNNSVHEMDIIERALAQLIGDESPITLEQFLMRGQITTAMRLKGLELLVLGCHTPCGAAYGKDVDFFHLLRHTFKAKAWLKSIPGLRVAVFPHVDYGSGKKRTYAISAHEFNRFAMANQIFAEG